MEGILFLAVLALLAWLAAKVARFRRLAAAKRREQTWHEVIEPRCRSYRGYPPDWDMRRVHVYMRARGVCETCGVKCANLDCSPEMIWHSIYPHVTGGHVHHVVPMSKGGDHSLENLQFLCEGCHARAHSKNPEKINVRQHNRSREIKFIPGSKVRTARKQWTCEICNGTIQRSERYFGNNFLRVCMQCNAKYYKKRKASN
jgi:5-methylcytosine-specific restriction endonuclease McrA